VKKRLCANCMQAYDAGRMRRAGGNDYCVLCYEDLLETSKLRPPVRAAIPDEIAAELEEAEAARRSPALIAEAGALEASLRGEGEAALAAPAGAAAPAVSAVPPEIAALGPTGLERKMMLAQEVAVHYRRRFIAEMALLALKLAVYGGLITAAAVCGGVVRFTLVGFFAADFIVWVAISVFSMPFSKTTLAVEFAVYFSLMIFFASGTELFATPTNNDEMVFTAGAFLVTGFVKGAYHGSKLVNDIFG